MADRLFDPDDSSTWPVTLTLVQLAAIYQRTPEAIGKTLEPKWRGVPFQPAPFKRRPYRWRRSDVLRDVRPEGVAPVALRRVS